MAFATIDSTDERQFTATVYHARGSTQNPLTDDELIAKFRANASGVMSEARQDEIVEATWGFDGLADAGAYMELLVADGF
ncbi:MmgE/PrpD family protein [bacterium]|nr:MmgE/PrpD family protein [bacterium]MBU1674461.1 MmgE/PrpD family protein [bacterium]